MPKTTSFRQRIARAALLFLALILAACGATNPYLPGTTQTAAATPSIVIPTNTQPAASATATLDPTEIAYWNAITALRTEFPDCGYFYSPDNTFSKSPDGKWTIAKCLELILKQKNGETITIAPSSFSSFFAPSAEYQELHAEPEFWSLDNKILYFSAQAARGSGCGCFCYQDGVALFQLDISSRKISALLVPKEFYRSFRFAFSPDGKQLAYTENNNPNVGLDSNRLVIRDLKTGRERIKIFDEYTEIGNLVWSPDSQKLALGMAFCADDTHHTFNLGLVNIPAGLSPKIILTKSGPELDDYYWHIDTWRNDNVIILTRAFLSIEVDLSGPQPVIITGTPWP